MRVRIVLRLRSGTGDLLLAHVAEDLVAVLFAVGSAADMDPVVTTVGGLHNQLVKVGVVLQEVEPLLGEFHVGVELVVIPVRVGIERHMDVGSFSKNLLAGVRISDIDVKLRATRPRWC